MFIDHDAVRVLSVSALTATTPVAFNALAPTTTPRILLALDPATSGSYTLTVTVKSTGKADGAVEADAGGSRLSWKRYTSGATPPIAQDTVVLDVDGKAVIPFTNNCIIELLLPGRLTNEASEWSLTIESSAAVGAAVMIVDEGV